MLQVIKGPVTKHFPLNSHRVGFSHSAQGVVPFQQHVQGLDDNTPVVLVVGAFAHGKIDAPWVDEAVSISQYPLSAAYVLGRITNAFEQKWQIV
jgi:rRNA small subunit pseudouridine methyltransferase Nep1